MKYCRPYVLLAVAGAALTLAGCQSDKEAALCPGATALVEASTMTVFPAGTAPDPAHALYRVGVESVTSDCDIDNHERTADTSVEIHFKATRATAGEAIRYRVPYFVAVRQGPDILSKKLYWATFGFSAGETAVEFSEDLDSTVKIASDKQPYDYQVLTGLQLTHDQLDYNRKTGYNGP